MDEERPSLFERLDFIYLPSADAAADVERFTRDLGGRVVFAIERFGTRVAMLELTAGPPARPAALLRGPGRAAPRDLRADRAGPGREPRRAPLLLSVRSRPGRPRQS